MRFEIDLSKAPRIRPLPDGVYIINLISFEQKKSKADIPKLTWKARVLKPTEIAEQIPEIWFDTSLSPGALFHLADLYEAITGKVPGATGFDPADLCGKEVGVNATLEDSPEFGKRNKFRWIPVRDTKPTVAPAATASANPTAAPMSSSTTKPPMAK